MFSEWYGMDPMESIFQQDKSRVHSENTRCSKCFGDPAFTILHCLTQLSGPQHLRARLGLHKKNVNSTQYEQASGSMDEL